MVTYISANTEVIEAPLSKTEVLNLVDSTLNVLQVHLSPARCGGKNTYLSIRLDSNEEVQTLNNNFRGKNKPTNVLSFPTEDAEAWDEEEQTFYLGDIIIASQIVIDEATAANIPFEHHLQHMIVHGTLHLFGFDHILDNEANIMENAEKDILKKLDIPNPYE